MIDFSCACGQYKFSLADEMAGGLIQCPKCRRLNDVPTLTDLRQIDEDGAYKLEPEPEVPHGPQVVQKMSRAFTHQHFDETGEEIDLRNTIDDIDEVRSEHLVTGGTVPIDRPHYDPMTGELVRPLDINPVAAHPAIPVAKPAPLGYARPGVAFAMTYRQIPVRLMQPANLFVMVMIVLAHALIQPMNVMMRAGLFLVAPIWLLGVMSILSHYANVIDETGPSDHDELPRPLRDASISDDIWNPFTHVVGAAILCFWPLFLASSYGLSWSLQFAITVFCGFWFPAVLLTLCTSGTTANLRPDRIVGVIRAIGAPYFAMVLLFLAADLTYGLGLWRFNNDFLLLFAPRSMMVMFNASAPWWFQPWIGYPALIAGILLMHGFCWSLGIAYRLHHDQFPWILQRHIPTRLKDRTRRRKPAANVKR